MNSNLFFAVGLVFLPLAHAARAQETNVYLLTGPPTKLEALETNTDTVIIKGTAQIGSIYLVGVQVSVACREDILVGTTRKEFGLTLDIVANNQFNERVVIDDDEVDSLLGALDYLVKVDWSVASLTSFDAVYTTKAGFRLAAFSSKSSRTVEFRMRTMRMDKGIPITPSQLAQFRELISQAKTKLDSIKPK